MPKISKAIAIAKVTDPTAVKSRCVVEGEVYKEGSIYCEIPELGFISPDLIYCRYGLSIPYLRIQSGWTLLAEPTIGEDGRWFFTGIADCAALAPVDADQLLIQLASQVIYASTAGKIHLSSKTASQPFVNGTNLQTWAGNVDQALAALYAWASAGITAGPANVLLATPNPDATGFPTNALSTKIMGE